MIVLGLGSNTGDRVGYLLEAVALLAGGAEPLLTSVRLSSLYQSDAMLLSKSPDEWNRPFLNLALCGCAEISPESMLERIKVLELQIGRQPRGRWAPREIDIDILWWEEEYRESGGLEIPHPGLLKRPFALLPAAELIPALADQQPLFNHWLAGASYPAADDSVPSRTRVAQSGLQWKFSRGLRSRGIQANAGSGCTELVGIVNVTPDSFSDGGKYHRPDNALHRIEELYRSGAAIIDIGAESTRPGSVVLTVREELQRLRPVLEAFRERFPIGSSGPMLSVDTRRGAVVREVLEFVPDWINDVSGGESAELVESLSGTDCRLVIMHNLGIPPSKDRTLPLNGDLVGEVSEWLFARIEMLGGAGIHPSRVIVDPGIGFGKTSAQSFTLLREVSRICSGEYPLLVGHSRKSFLSEVTGQPFAERDVETIALNVSLRRRGVQYLRVHNVEMAARALRAAVCVS